MLVHSLVSHYLKRTLRSPFGTWILGGNVLMALCFWAPVLLYAFYMGFSVVRFLEIDPSVDLLARVNPVLAPALIIGGLVDGMLLRRRAHVPLFPYLATPTARQKLALFYQIVMLCGKFNLFALTFITGFWVKNLYLRDVAFAWNWLLVLCLAYACMHFAANILRFWRGRGYLPLLGIWLCVAALAALEWGYETRMLSVASATLFHAAETGAAWPSMLLAILGGGLFYGAVRSVRQSLYMDYSAASGFMGKKRVFRTKRNARNLTAELRSCEWKLILRNRQPRVIAMASMGMMFFVIFMITALGNEMDFINIPFIELNLLYLILYSLMYFASALDFRHSFYDGMNVWPISENTLLRILLSISHRGILTIVIIFIFSIISINMLFYKIIYFEWIFVHGILLFSMGIINYTALFLNILFPVPRPPNANVMEPNISLIFVVNTQAILMNCFFILILALPGILALLQSVSRVWLGLSLGALGLVGLCFQPWLTKRLARRLRARRYVVLGRFRV